MVARMFLGGGRVFDGLGPGAVRGAEDITAFGGWRAYLDRLDSDSHRRLVTFSKHKIPAQGKTRRQPNVRKVHHSKEDDGEPIDQTTLFQVSLVISPRERRLLVRQRDSS